MDFLKSTRFWVITLLGFISIGIISIMTGVYSEVKIDQKESDGWELVGIEYEGKADSQVFINLYDSISKEIERDKLSGNLAVLFFQNPNTDKPIKAIVGALSTNKVASQQNGYKVYKQGPYLEVYSEIKMGELFTPNPENVINQINDLIEMSFGSVPNKYLEYYPSKSTVIQSAIVE
ncbi:hypothetical protein [Flammeovirga kamogawensis]|uniref:GyrI-like domain-containing protein n=1 Tax=Flammeovirga kamogawensis TaxID=373891 RepID=A0ABX8GTS7_9BACT|nr:hypothetical protein [Flammeovirga kamogawensis]MBB6459949.1 hypothetical protein [Flammeovirga kamogawensis]QWG07000.1 hypothetical protein KM029_17115 [Flammeovirga kamogawensis]TRX68821.1 hypothetical protein EO216_12100 [Flammeovirga kamogawensis]